MKKKLAALLIAVLCMSLFAGCGSKKKDLDYIKDNGEMIMGITIFEPMNYKDASGPVLATLFIYRNNVVAGDLSAGAPNGFVCGFDGKQS